MSDSKNPYLDLIEDDQPVKHAPAHHELKEPVQAIDTKVEKGLPQTEEVNPYLGLIGDEEIHHDISGSIPGALAGAATGWLNSGATLRHPLTPSIPVAPSVADIAKAAGVAKGSGSSGYNWLKNWGNIEKEGFAGGVPEASNAYNRSKSSGKVISKVEKKFGINPKLSIHGQAAQAEANEAMKLLQEQAAKHAKFAGPLSVLGKVAKFGGAGFGALDAYRRFEEGDKTGAGLAAGATGLGMAFPPVAIPLAAGVGLYDDPKAREKFLKDMQPGGAWQGRMEGRFGLD
jgi:hypothetical protein